MATLNKLTLAGYIYSLPVEIEDPSDKIHKLIVTFELLIERKELNIHDVLTIKAYDSVAARLKNELKLNEYFISEDAHIRTTNYDKKITLVCSHCHTVYESSMPAEKTEVVVDDYIMIPKTKVKTLLGINTAMLLGNICTDLNVRTMNNGKAYTKYKLAVNREGWLKKLQKSDYPFIVNFGYEAESAAKYLQVSDLVLVEGAVQERSVSHTYEITCSECGNTCTETKITPVVEVIASNVEYLKGIKLKTEEELLKEMAEDAKGPNELDENGNVIEEGEIVEEDLGKSEDELIDVLGSFDSEEGNE